LFKAGYAFDGWNTASDGSGTDYVAGVAVTMPAAALTLYAQWIINQYSVTYNANGGTLGTVPGVQNANYGATVTVSGNIGNLVGPFIQDGIRQRFVEWNTDPTGTGTPYAGGASLILGAANVTLYAQYTATGTVIGKLGPAGGFVFYDKTNMGDGWRYLEVVPISHAAVPNWSNITATLIGGTSAGFGSGIFNTLLILSQAGHTSSAASIADAYTKTYDGIIYDDWFLPSTDEINEAFTALNAADIGAGAYWSSREQAANSAYCPAQSNTTHAVVKNQAGYPFRSVRAFATAAETYVIHYLANGADTGTAPADVMHYNAGGAITFANDNGMTKLAASPTGWNTQADGMGTDYALSGAGIMPAGNLVLYAKW
jgi:uncharacterized repeat protein (TIGR02543 family)